jgi:hypothetical protein
MDDLRARTDVELNENSPVICLLDSGVNNQHPLLSSFLPNAKLYTYNDAWGTDDGYDGGGHGTGMAGLSLYGDLNIVIQRQERISILHGLESFKIFNQDDQTEQEMYGFVVEYACSLPVIDNPSTPRLFCMAITDKGLAKRGRPSSCSAAVDRVAFGNGFEGNPQLFILSGGNFSYMLPAIHPAEYFSQNLIESIHDPGQSYNALTIGAFTMMDRVDQELFPGVRPLAPKGSMSPSNSTSLTWDHQWPLKPDLVMEGGNYGVRGDVVIDTVHSLKPLSLDKDFDNHVFTPMGDTSGAAALASKMAIEIMRIHPEYWPETIRGLLIHSADWTTQMLSGIDLSTATVPQKKQLLRSYGYGVPDLEKSLYCASDLLTLVAERNIQPYKLNGRSAVYNEYHLYEIPWPSDVLAGFLSEMDVTLKVTISYFIDPNPGDRRYANNFNYHSHALDFKVIKATEDLEMFKRRISSTIDDNGEAEYDGHGEPWWLKDGLRSRGSVRKDLFRSSGADLASRKYIAVYPKAGWYKTRVSLGRSEAKVRYSLIIGLETEDLEADIYAPVSNLIETDILIR